MSQLPIPPKPSTLDAKALELLRTRPSMTSLEFQKESGSQRLAACIHRLRELGWPILAATISTAYSRRGYARYFLQIVDDVHEK